MTECLCHLCLWNCRDTSGTFLKRFDLKTKFNKTALNVSIFQNDVFAVIIWISDPNNYCYLRLNLWSNMTTSDQLWLSFLRFFLNKKSVLKRPNKYEQHNKLQKRIGVRKKRDGTATVKVQNHYLHCKWSLYLF
jgi:hypothetical protein